MLLVAPRLCLFCAMGQSGNGSYDPWLIRITQSPCVQTRPSAQHQLIIFEAQLEAVSVQLGTPRAHQERHVWHIPWG